MGKEEFILLFVTRGAYFIEKREVSVIPINLCFLTILTFPKEDLKFQKSTLFLNPSQASGSRL